MSAELGKNKQTNRQKKTNKQTRINISPNECKPQRHNDHSRILKFSGRSHFRCSPREARGKCTSSALIPYYNLLHIMCGYQCDKAVNKNDTREVI